MASLVVYGSLMAHDELLTLGINLSSTMPVIVQGFRRSFSQEPSWRQGQGLERAVLTVRRSPQSSFNGILLADVSLKLFSHLDHRERGYDRVQLTGEEVRSFREQEAVTCNDPFLYVGKHERYKPYLRPNPIYRQQCLDAAQDWGHDFYQEFYNSTDNLT